MTKQRNRNNTLRILFRAITIVALGAAAVVMAMIYGTFQDMQSALANAVIALMAIIALYSAIMIYALFVGAAKGPVSKKTAKDDDRLLIEWLVLVGGVMVIMAIALVPSLVMGIFTTDNTSTGQAATILYLMMFIGLLFGPLITAGIFVPIRLLITGTAALVRGDRSKVGQIRLGGAITALTVFCLTTGFAIHPYASGVGGWGLVILGILGVPSAYEVKNETLLWIARIVLVVIIVALIASARLNGKARRKSS